MLNKKSVGRPLSPTRHWLIQARYDSGKQFKELVKEMGVTQQAISNWETGKRTPRTKLAKKYAEILGFDWTKFYEENNIQSQEKESG